jgi:RNA polymerase sigma-70 factor (ECF subfamily)
VKEHPSAALLGQADESVVIALACTRDPQAFAEMVRRSQNRVRSFMHRLCNHPDLAEDLAQQVFLKVWKSIHQLRAPGAFYGWLNKIMVSIWLEDIRRNKLDLTELSESIVLEAPKETPGERIDLDAALAQLSPPMRLCVVLAYNDGLSHQEISEATNIPLGTVKANISRGTAKMRVLLSDYRNGSQGYSDAG